jgi:hypothetical protein
MIAKLFMFPGAYIEAYAELFTQLGWRVRPFALGKVVWRVIGEVA